MNEYNDDEITINDLNEDCLRQVLNWLNLKEKFAVDRVCKSWSVLICDLLKSNQTELVFGCCRNKTPNELSSAITFELIPEYLTHQKHDLMMHHLRHSRQGLAPILSKTPSVQTIIFNIAYVSADDLIWLCEQLPLISSIDFDKVMITDNGGDWERFSQLIGPKLRHLSASQMFHSHFISFNCGFHLSPECKLTTIIKYTSRLESLKFSGGWYSNAAENLVSIFQLLPSTMRQISLLEVEGETWMAIMKFVSKNVDLFSNLRNVTHFTTQSFSLHQLELLPLLVPNLAVLRLEKVKFSHDINSMKTMMSLRSLFSSLTNLNSLFISRNHATDEDLSKVLYTAWKNFSSKSHFFVNGRICK